MQHFTPDKEEIEQSSGNSPVSSESVGILSSLHIYLITVYFMTRKEKLSPKHAEVSQKRK